LLTIFFLFEMFVSWLSGFSQNVIKGDNNEGREELIFARQVASIPDEISESSGIAVATPNHIWSHNDAGNTNELFCFDTTGTLLRQLLISNVNNIDWEDLTQDDQQRMYINDAGNNGNDRRNLKIYRIPNPENISGNIVQAEIIKFDLEDQVQFPPPESNWNYDIEAIIWKSDSLYLFTKNRCNPQTGICKLYKVPAQPGNHIAQLMDAVFLGTSDKEARVTSADINLSTGELLLLTETKIVSFTDYPDNRFFDGNMTSYYFSNTVGQVEGVGFVGNGNLYLTEEGNENDNGFLYTVKWKNTSAVTEKMTDKISLFPNPFTSEITADLPFDGSVTMDIIDIEGNVVLQNIIYEKQLCLNHLNPGIYIIKITTEHKTFIRRIVKL